MPKVSICIPSYNHGRFIGTAIESILNQSYTDWELLIQDDCSLDDTQRVLQTYSDSRIIIHHNSSNLGPVVTLNAVMSQAQGVYLSFLASDDYFFPHKLTTQVAYLDAHPECGAVFGLPMVIDDHNTHLDTQTRLWSSGPPSRPQQLQHLFFHDNYLCHPTVMMRRSVFQELGPYDLRLRQLPDYDYWIRLLTKYSLHVLPDQVTALRKLANMQNESAPRPEVLARTDWERFYVLRRYLDLDKSLFEETFAQEIHTLDLKGLDRQVQLGRIAGAAQHKSVKAFGLDLLWHAVSKGSHGITIPELWELAGSLDIFGANMVPTQALADVRLEIETIRKDIHHITNSKSWRMTSFARILMRRLLSMRAIR